jgi:hypothetical protein
MCSLFVDSGLFTQREYRITALTKGSDGRTYKSSKAHSLNMDHELRHTHTHTHTHTHRQTDTHTQTHTHTHTHTDTHTPIHTHTHNSGT